MTRSSSVGWASIVVLPALAALIYLDHIRSPFFMAGVVTVIGSTVLAALALWLVPTSAALPPIPVPRPWREAAVILIFVLLWSIVFLGWGLTHLANMAPAGRERFVWKILLKLVTMVALPSAALIAAGGSVRQQWRGRFGLRGFWLPLLVLGTATVIVAFADPTAARPSEVPARELWFIAPLTLLWIGIEAGLCEEYLFRACLQTRLAAWLRSDIAAVSLTAQIFGLTHFPGFAFRQPPPGVPGGMHWATLAYCLTAVAPLGVFYGVIWARTRNLWLGILIHGLADMSLIVVMKTVWFP